MPFLYMYDTADDTFCDTADDIFYDTADDTFYDAADDIFYDADDDTFYDAADDIFYDTADDIFYDTKYTSSCALICIILFSDVCPYFTGASRTTVPVFISSGRVIWLFPARKIVPLSHRDR